MHSDSLNPTDRFEVSGPDIVHETIEGEVVIVNLKNGFYYSTEKTGCPVWNLLVAGRSFGEIVEALAERFPDRRDEINTSTGRIVADLLAEELIAPAAGSGPGTDNLPDIEYGSEFTPPVLEKHKEMQDLLLVDPIHEVEETGWPNKKADQPAEG